MTISRSLKSFSSALKTDSIGKLLQNSPLFRGAALGMTKSSLGDAYNSNAGLQSWTYKEKKKGKMNNEAQEHNYQWLERLTTITINLGLSRHG